MRRLGKDSVRMAGGALLALAVAGVVAMTGAQTSPPKADAPRQPVVRSFAPPPGALIAPGESPDLSLLYTGNVVGYLDPCG